MPSGLQPQIDHTPRNGQLTILIAHLLELEIHPAGQGMTKHPAFPQTRGQWARDVAQAKPDPEAVCDGERAEREQKAEFHAQQAIGRAEGHGHGGRIGGESLSLVRREGAR